jgi:hypothetical protein
MDTHLFSEAPISRRNVLTSSAAFLAGGGIGGGLTAFAAAPESPVGAPPLPWP